MSPRDGAIELLNTWKSGGSLIKLVFIGTENLLTLTLQGKIAGVGNGVSITGSEDLFANFSFASARLSSGSPKGNGNPEVAALCDTLRFREVPVVEIFGPLGDVLIFPVLDALDISSQRPN